jgi:Icc-related predicted phosphoesterase
VFGHIHEDRGAWRHGPTVFANVTTDESRLPPTVIDLDETGARVVVDGVEIV